MKVDVLIVGFQEAGEADSRETARLARRAVEVVAKAGIRARAVAVPLEPDLGLLKALESVDLQLPEAVLVLGRSREQTGMTVERLALNREDPAAGRIEPIDPTGPAFFACTLPVAQLVARAASAGIGPFAAVDTGSRECNRLAYGLLRYVSLRGQETWFRRKPPAGLSARIGTMHLPESAGRPEAVEARARPEDPAIAAAREKAVRAVVLAIEEIADR